MPAVERVALFDSRRPKRADKDAFFAPKETYFIRSKLLDKLKVTRRRARSHIATMGLGNLNRECADTATAIVDENAVSLLNLGILEEQLPRG